MLVFSTSRGSGCRRAPSTSASSSPAGSLVGRLCGGTCGGRLEAEQARGKAGPQRPASWAQPAQHTAPCDSRDAARSSAGTRPKSITPSSVRLWLNTDTELPRIQTLSPATMPSTCGPPRHAVGERGAGGCWPGQPLGSTPHGTRHKQGGQRGAHHRQASCPQLLGGCGGGRQAVQLRSQNINQLVEQGRHGCRQGRCQSGSVGSVGQQRRASRQAGIDHTRRKARAHLPPELAWRIRGGAIQIAAGWLPAARTPAAAAGP